MTGFLTRFLLILVATATIASAQSSDQSVVLTTLDGELTVEGELISYEGELFRVETEFGPVTLDGGNVTCEGPGCPPAEALLAEAVIVGSLDLLTELVAPLVSGFAVAEGFAFSEEFIADDHIIWRLSDIEADQMVARIEALSDARRPDLGVRRGEPDEGALADVIALDALVVVVSPENDLALMPVETLRLILEGRLKAWPDWMAVGAPTGSRDIDLVLPEPLLGFDRLFPDRPLLSPSEATRIADVDDLADKVAGSANALGVAPLSRIGNASPLILAGTCGRAMPATAASLKAEDYPLTDPIFLTRYSARLPRVLRDLVAFMKSDDAQPIIRSTGLIDQSIGRTAFADQGDRLGYAVLAAGDDPVAIEHMRRMIRALVEAERLTLTFRFEDGSSALDAPSRSNARQLAEAIADGKFDGKELLFAGFTDSLGDLEPNLRLSQRRAESAFASVRAQLGNPPVGFAAEGFGEALPIACDDTDWGRHVNRRVEVWVRPLPAEEN
ncbi:MAG: phosphate ABC transporter substrate-binding/OmpA family protein [Boseongicola sp.]|nr:phosphate ABC transporter substrate-binding/OmpA family protein [Boseongicola sp.]